MNKNKTIGALLITGVIGVLTPYIVLSSTFEYPDILRQDPGIILTKFNEGGGSLILTWWLFAILGLPLMIAYILLGQQLETKWSNAKWVTTIGVISGIVQIVGLLRWVFVMPAIAHNYVTASDAATKAAAVSAFQTMHQFGGVLLGEHLGQLFTVIWTIMICVAFLRLQLFSSWVSWFGIVASVIYFIAQAELFATVIPGFPAWDMAGFIGSTLWLVWLLIVGVKFLRRKETR